MAAFCEQVRAAVAPAQQRGRVAIGLADHRRTHMPAGSKLVRQMVDEVREHL